MLQPVTESATLSVANRDSIETPVDDSVSDEGSPATPPMPVLVEGEDFGDEDESSFELEQAVASKLESKSDAASDAPPPLTNGLVSGKEHEVAPVLSERVNGDHEEPVLEKFFRLFTPSAQSPPPKEAISEPPPPASTSAPTPTASPKRRRPYTPRRQAEDRSPSAKRSRGKAGRGRPSKATEVFDFDSEQERPEPRGRKRGPKPKGTAAAAAEAPKLSRPTKDVPKPNALENRYLRSPYIISTAESDSIMSRFQVVNPAYRDAASVNVTDHPFKHAVKLPPHAGLAKSAWVCVFCGLGTSFANLGCLFGPYYIDFNKFTAHPDLISTAKPSPPPDLVPAAVASSTPAAVEKGEEESRRRLVRRLSRGANNTTAHSSISSFRHSKARAGPLQDAKDVRRGSTDSDKAPNRVKQVDIASVFFSEQAPDKEAKLNGKEASRRKSEVKEEEKPIPEPPNSPKSPRRPVGKRKSASPAVKPRRSVGRPPKETKEAEKTINCQSKAAKPCERRPSAEQPADTRIAANGEAWTHLECVLWASGTYLNGKQIVGLEDALSEALQTVS